MTDSEHTNGETESTPPIGDSRRVDRVRIKVNGVVIEVTETVIVREVLQKAKDHGAIADSVEEYVLERVTVEGEIGLDETITVVDLEEFMSVPIGKTEVA